MGVNPHMTDRKTQETDKRRKSNYNTSQPQYNQENVNIRVIRYTDVPERDHNKQNNQWHDRWFPHSVANGPTSVSAGVMEIPLLQRKYFGQLTALNGEPSQWLRRLSMGFRSLASRLMCDFQISHTSENARSVLGRGRRIRSKRPSPNA